MLRMTVHAAIQYKWNSYINYLVDTPVSSCRAKKFFSVCRTCRCQRNGAKTTLLIGIGIVHCGNFPIMFVLFVDDAPGKMLTAALYTILFFLLCVILPWFQCVCLWFFFWEPAVIPFKFLTPG